METLDAWLKSLPDQNIFVPPPVPMVSIGVGLEGKLRKALTEVFNTALPISKILSGISLLSSYYRVVIRSRSRR
jgi:hypothetical protein